MQPCASRCKASRKRAHYLRAPNETGLADHQRGPVEVGQALGERGHGKVLGRGVLNLSPAKARSSTAGTSHHPATSPAARHSSHADGMASGNMVATRHRSLSRRGLPASRLTFATFSPASRPFRLAIRLLAVAGSMQG